jgi:hypothetical protein
MSAIQYTLLILVHTKMENFSNDQYYEETSQYPDLTNSGAEPVQEHEQTSAQIYPPYSTFTSAGIPYGSGHRYPHMYPSGIPESNMVQPGTTTTVHQSVGAFQPIGLHPQSGIQGHRMAGIHRPPPSTSSLINQLHRSTFNQGLAIIRLWVEHRNNLLDPTGIDLSRSRLSQLPVRIW